MKLTTKALMLGLTLLSMEPSLACTRILKADPDHAVMVGRTMDWMDELHTDLVVYPRGIERNGETQGKNRVWSSKYASIVATAYTDIATDGFNEAGLSAHVLWLAASDFGTPSPKKPGLSVKWWAQYYLDNFSTVKEAVDFTANQSLKLTPYFHPAAGRWMQVHLVIEDATGDSAIFEYTKGQLQIYHDKSNTALTNDPTYDQQLLNLKNYRVFGGEKPLPGTNSSFDRFVRSTHYGRAMKKVDSAQEQLAAMFSILANTSQPYSTYSEENPYDSKTVWRAVSDLTNKVYYFQSSDSLKLLEIKMNKFNLAKGASVMHLDLEKHPDYVGAIEDKFQVHYALNRTKNKVA